MIFDKKRRLEIGRNFIYSEGSKLFFFSIGLIIASLRLTGKNADSIDKLTILRITELRVSRVCRSTCVGMGSGKRDFFASGRMIEYNSSIAIYLN